MFAWLKEKDFSGLWVLVSIGLIFGGPYFLNSLSDSNRNKVVQKSQSEEERYLDILKSYSKNIADLDKASGLFSMAAISIISSKDAECLLAEHMHNELNNDERQVIKMLRANQEALCQAYTLASQLTDIEVSKILHAITTNTKLPLWEYKISKHNELKNQGIFTSQSSCEAVVDKLEEAAQDVTNCQPYEPIIYDLYWSSI